jgi:malonyl-CoA O-methyltransferase
MNKLIINAFNKAATTYDEHNQLQRKCGEQLITFAKRFTNSKINILDAGCGSGILTMQLAKQFSYQLFHAIDLSFNMLKKASDTCCGQNILFTQANFENYQPPIKFDLIFSNMALHWSDNFTFCLQHLLNLLKQNGQLLFTVPLEGTFIELTDFSKNIFMAEEEIKCKLSQQIFFLKKEKIQLKFANTLAALQSIKKTGANYVRQRLTAGLSGKNILHKNINTLTYVIGYFTSKLNA